MVNKFTKSEINFLLESPEALRLVADYRESQDTMGDAMGLNCIGDKLRAKQLREEADKIEREL